MWMLEENEKKDYLLKRQAKAYAGASTIHGLTYIAEDGRPNTESILWFILWLVSAGLCVFLFVPIYTKWRSTPTYTSVDSTNYPVWKINFPAVTICSNIMVNDVQLDYQLKKEPWKSHQNELGMSYGEYKILTKDVLKKYIYFTLVGQELFSDIDQDKEAFVQKHKKNISTLMRQVKHKCSDILLNCMWQGEQEDCMKMFEVSRTDSGFCCSFNAIKLAEQFDDSDDTPQSITANESIDGFYGGYNYYYGGGYYDYSNFHDYYWGDYYGEDTTDTTGTTTAGTATTTAGTATTTAGTATTTAGTATTTADATTPTTANSAKRRRKREATVTETPPGITSTSSTTKKPRTAPTPNVIRRSNSASSLLGLTAVLKVDTYNYDGPMAVNDFYGFRVLVHNPYDFPEVAGKGMAVGAGNVAYIAVDAQVTTSTPAVNGMSINRRNCIKPDEEASSREGAGIKMEIFESYSRPSCLIECRARYLQERCGCLPYYFPNFAKVWKKDTTCGFDGLICISKEFSILTALKTDEDDDASHSFAQGAECHCPVDCEATNYVPEMSQVAVRPGAAIIQTRKQKDEWFDNQKNKVDKLYEDLSQLYTKQANLGSVLLYSSAMYEVERQINETMDKIWEAEGELAERDSHAVYDLAAVHVYFKELGIVKYNRDELYRAIDVIASFGGIIGLCMGFSLLSGVEIVYWFSIRMWNDKKATRNK